MVYHSDFAKTHPTQAIAPLVTALEQPREVVIE